MFGFIIYFSSDDLSDLSRFMKSLFLFDLSRLERQPTRSVARLSADVTSLVVSDSSQAFSDRRWTLSARFRAGMGLDQAQNRNCPDFCVPSDPVGDDAFCCAKLCLYARHNAIRNEFAAVFDSQPFSPA